MKYQQQLTIKKVDEDEEGNIHLKVYIPKYIEEQIDILLNNRSVRFEKKCIRKISEVRHYKNKVTVVTKSTVNMDTLDISTIVNVLLGIKTKVESSYDKEGRYWYMIINNTLEYIVQKLIEMDKYFNSAPLIKEYVVVEQPTVTLSDLNINLVFDGVDKNLFRSLRS